LGILATLNAVLGERVSQSGQFIIYQLLLVGAAGGIIWLLVGRTRAGYRSGGDRRRVATYIAEVLLRRRHKGRE